MRSTVVAAMTRLYPFYSGCGAFANCRLVRLLAGQAPHRRWARVYGGHVLADTNEYIGRAAYYVGALDRKVTWICKQVVRPGDMVIDVGANIGLVTVALASMVGPHGRVFAFEPMPDLYAGFQQTIRRNRLHNVELMQMALGATTKEMDLRVPLDNVGRASLLRTVEHAHKVVPVPVRRLDDVVSSDCAWPVRLIKIDVEGFEAQVIRGAERFLRRHRPLVLFEENGGHRESFHLLRQHGYAFFKVPKCYVRMRLQRCSEPEGNDFLAAPLESYEVVAKQVRA